MNILKFRAWDKVNKKMIDCEDILSICFRGKEISIEHVGIFDENAIPHIRTIIFKLENIELMQSSGLCDKNDVEVFEGDILHDKEKSIKFVVNARNGCFVADEIENRTYLWEVNSRTEVIGNIYENPELLEGVRQ